MECGEEIPGWRGELKAGYTFSRNSPELWVLVLSARATLTQLRTLPTGKCCPICLELDQSAKKSG